MMGPGKIARNACLVVGVTLSLLGAFAWGQQKAEPANKFVLKEHPLLQRVYVAEKELQREAKGMVPLDRDEFIESWGKLHKPFDQTIVPAVEQIVAEATLEPSGTLSGKMEITWKGAAPRKEGESLWIALGECSMAISKARWKSDEAEQQEEGTAKTASGVILGQAKDGGLVLVADQQGPVVVDWHLAPAQANHNPLEYVFHFPKASRTRLSILLPEGFVASPDGMLVAQSNDSVEIKDPKTGNSSAYRRWNFVQANRRDGSDATGAGRLKLTRQGNSTVRPKYLVYSEATTAVLSPADLLFETNLHCEAMGGSFSETTLQLPAEVKILSCKLNQVDVPLQPIVGDDANEAQYLLTFPKSIVGAGNQLQVQGVLPVKTGDAWSLPRMYLAQGKWQEGTCQVSVDSRVQLRIAGLQGCELLGASSGEGADRRELLKFKLFSPQFQANMVVLPFSQPLKATSGTTLTVESAQATAVVQTQLESKEQPLFDVQVLLPRRWIVDSLETTPPDLLEDRTTSTPRGDFDKIHLRLREPIVPGRPLHLTIRAHRPRAADQENLPDDLLPAAIFPQAILQESWLKLLVGAPNLSADFFPSATFLPVPGSQVPGEIQSLLAASAEGKLLKLPSTGLMPTIRLTTSETSFDAEQSLHYEITKDRLRSESRMLCRPEGGLVSRVFVRASLPPSGTISWEIVGEGAEGLSVIPTEQITNTNTTLESITGWLIELRRPRLAPFEIVARFEQPRAEQQTLPLLSLVEAAHHTGELSLSIEGETRFQIESQGMREVPDLRGGLNPSRIRRHRFLYEPSKAAQISLREIDPKLSSPLAWLEYCQLSTFVDASDTTLHEALCGVHNLGSEQLGITLPEGCSILQVASATQGGLLDYAVDSKGKATILLPPQQDFLWLRLVFSSRDAGRQAHHTWYAPLMGKSVAAPMPKFSVPVRECRWKVFIGDNQVAERRLTDSGHVDWSSSSLGFLPRSLLNIAMSEPRPSLALTSPTANWAASPTIPTNIDSELRQALYQWLQEPLPSVDPTKPLTWNDVFKALELQLGSSKTLKDPRLWIAADELDSCGIHPTDNPRFLVVGPGVGTHQMLLERAFLQLRVEGERMVLGRPLPKPGFLPAVNTANLAAEASVSLGAGLLQREEWSKKTGPRTISDPSLTSPIAPWRWREASKSLELSLSSQEIQTIRIYRRDLLGLMALTGLVLSLWLTLALNRQHRLTPWCLAAILGFATFLVPMIWAALASGGVWGCLLGILVRFWRSQRAQLGPQSRSSDATKRRGGISHRPQTIPTIGVFLLLALPTALLGQLTVPQEGAEESEQAPTTTNSWTVVIPTDEDGEPSGDYVYVSPAFFDLLKQAERTAGAPQGRWLGLHSRWEIQVSDPPEVSKAASTSLKLLYDLQVLDSDTTVILPFLRDQVTPLTGSLLVDNQPTVWQWSSDGKGLQLDRLAPGRHHVELQVAALIKRAARGSCELSIETPPAAESEVWVTTELSNAAVNVANSQRQQTVDLPAGTLFSLSTTGKFAVRWETATLSSAQRNQVQADQSIWWRLTPQMAWGEVYLRLASIDDQALTEVALSVSDSITIQPIPADSPFSVVREEPLSDGKHKQIILRLTTPTRRAELRLPIALEWSSASQHFKAPSVRPFADQWQSSALVLTNCTGQELDAGKEPGAIPLRGSDVNLLFPALAGTTGWHAFELIPGGVTPEFYFASIVSKLSPSDATNYFLAGSTGEFTTTLTLSDSKFPVTPLDITYSEPVSIQQLKLFWGDDEVPCRWHASENGISVIPFAANPGSKGRVEIHGTFPIANKDSFQLPLIVPTVPHQRSTISVQHYPGIAEEILLQQGYRVAGEDPFATDYPWEPGIRLISDDSLSDNLQRRVNLRLIAQPSEWHLEQTTLLEANQGNWFAEIGLQGQVSVGSLHAIFFRSSSEIETKLECTDLKSQKALRVLAHGEGLHEIRLEEAVKEIFSIRIRAQVVTAKDQILRLPKVVVLDATSRQEFVSLPTRDGPQTIEWETRGLEPVDTSEADKGRPVDDQMIYRVLSPQFAAEIKEATETVHKPSLPWADYELVLQHNREISGRGVFWIDPAGLASVDLELLDGQELVAIQRDGHILEGVKLDKNRWRLPLGNSTLPTHLCIFFHGQLTTQGPSLDLHPIRFREVTPAQTTWRVLEASQPTTAARNWTTLFAGSPSNAGKATQPNFANEYLTQVDEILSLTEHTLQSIRTSETQSRQANWTRTTLSQLALQLAVLPLATDRFEAPTGAMPSVTQEDEETMELVNGILKTRDRWTKVLREGTAESYTDEMFEMVLSGTATLGSAKSDAALANLVQYQKQIVIAGVASDPTRITLPLQILKREPRSILGSMILLAILPMLIVAIILRNPNRLLPLASTPQLIPLCIGLLWMLWGPVAELAIIPLLYGVYLTFLSLGNRKSRGHISFATPPKAPSAA